MNPCRLSPFELIQRGILSWSISAEMGENVENSPVTSRVRLKTLLLTRLAGLRQSENQIFLVLAIVIGALTGFAVAAFIVLTERFGMRLYPVGGAPWRRLLFPVAGSLIHRLPAVSLFPQRARQRRRCLRPFWPGDHHFGQGYPARRNYLSSALVTTMHEAS